MINKLLNILFPETCPVCQGPSIDHRTAPICAGCWQSIKPYTGPKCRKCGRPLVSDTPTICGDCLQNEPPFTCARSFGIYDGALKKAINLLKFYGIKRLSIPLSDKILRLGIPRVDTVLPVPLYEVRLRQREFNQSALLANHIAGNVGGMLLIDCLVKIRDTVPQVGLSSHQRRKNIKGAFEIRNKNLIYGKDILLIDDVMTTGATVRECSKVLKKAGVGDIHVITLAHGMMD